jgi:GntR family transcriptional regulator, carbon starvation induced regulator
MLAPEAEARVTRATLAAQVEEAIRTDIIAGALEPGQRLRASELTQRYGVSATPLREALQRLAAQNLVELGPRLGATVAPISESELRDIYFLREMLETIALERSVRLGDAAWDRQVTRAYEAFERDSASDQPPSRSDILRWSAVHRTFHDSLFAACDSEWLLRFIGVLSDHSERYRMLSHRRARRHPIEEHRAIYVAAVGRDVEAAQAALRRHLSATVELLEQSRSTTSAPTDS